jgi:hypothetical protein
MNNDYTNDNTRQAEACADLTTNGLYVNAYLYSAKIKRPALLKASVIT